MRRAIARLLRRRGPSRASWSVDPVHGGVVGKLSLEQAIEAGIATVGRHTYWTSVDFVVWTGDRPQLRIGSFCSLAGGIRVFGGGRHNTDWITTFPLRAAWDLPGAHEDGHPMPPRPVTIGNDVWIGDGALILDGVTIGDGAVIAASAVVAKDVRPYAIVAGNPAAEVRRRFDDATVDRLLEVRWWDWPDERIRDRVDVLCSPDVDRLAPPASDVTSAGG